jgi:hypothetical protein
MKILEVTIVKTKSESVIARADVHFEGFLLKGFKILKDNKTNNEYVTPPSYFSPNGWRSLFKTDKPEDWKEIQHQIISKLNQIQIDESMNKAG